MKRILTGIVLVIAVVSLVLFGKMEIITALAALVAALAATEFRAFAEAGGCPIPMWWTIGSVAIFFGATFYRPQDTITAVSLCTLVLFLYSAFHTSIERVLWQTAAGLLMMVYIAFPLTLLPRILAQDNGTAILLFLFLCVWCGDIAALYIGKRFGRFKLAPTLSPNKTWEGAIASLFGSVFFGMALIGAGEYLSYIGSTFTKLHTTEPWWVYVALAAGLNIAAQLGDLLESALKRGAGVKDSGTLLPGHGGVLDRIDALLLAAPVLWYVIAVREYFAMGSL